MSNFSLRVLTLAAAGILAAVAVEAQSSSGDAKAGHDLFLKYTCYGCHGFSGQNGPGARLVPMKMTSTAFIAYVRGPRTRQMPSYSGKVLPDGQLADIYAYIKTLPDSPPASSIPALNQFKEQ